MLLYHHGVLPVRSAVRGTEGRYTITTCTSGGVGQADRRRYAVSAHAQTHPQRSQISKVSIPLTLTVLNFFFLNHED